MANVRVILFVIACCCCVAAEEAEPFDIQYLISYPITPRGEYPEDRVYLVGAPLPHGQPFYLTALQARELRVEWQFDELGERRAFVIANLTGDAGGFTRSDDVFLGNLEIDPSRVEKVNSSSSCQSIRFALPDPLPPENRLKYRYFYLKRRDVLVQRVRIPYEQLEMPLELTNKRLWFQDFVSTGDVSLAYRLGWDVTHERFPSCELRRPYDVPHGYVAEYEPRFERPKLIHEFRPEVTWFADDPVLANLRFPVPINLDSRGRNIERPECALSFQFHTPY